MENLNQTGQKDLSQLKSMFSDYQKKQSQSTTKKSREDLLAKYFVPRASKETYRILPPKAGKRHIEEAFFHVITTNAAGGKKKHGTVIYCPAHNDPKVPKLGTDGKPLLNDQGAPLMVPAPCPLCAKNKKWLAKQDPSLKGIKKENMNDAQLAIKAENDKIYKEAIKWEAKKFYIVRGIDKGKEKDGVKFWRFKHNYKNQGTLDKLLPILEDYMTTHQADFSDALTGTDLNIIMTDSEFNGHVYKAISAITARGKSPLHADKQVMQAWLDDDISWRDVFLPKKAPNTTPYEFLELCANETNPYWEDTDQTNKHWVFPGRPDLEKLANTRTMNLDSDEDNFEQATDLTTEELPRVTISNITEEKVGEFEDDAVDVGKAITGAAQPSAPPVTPAPTQAEAPVVEESEDDLDDDTEMDSEPVSEGDGTGSDYTDLPF